MAGIFTLNGTIKHYDWGGFSFIPGLLHVLNEGKTPFAEYWMGSHPQDHCTIELAGHRVLLNEYLEDHPEALGEYITRQFGHLPYLFKVLDVHKMLSIQVHPSKKVAEREFARENAEGIPLDSPHRNYRDQNHKPELMVAMGDFWLLHGFKPEQLLRDTLGSVPEFSILLSRFEQTGYGDLYKWVMTMPQEDVNAILHSVLDRIIPLYHNNRLSKDDEHFWAAKAALSYPGAGKIDRGIFSIYLFNLVHLKKGEGVFQGAGLPHAYLEGQNVEIMANSDNVLRGGLTSKHIDVKELLANVNAIATTPVVLTGNKTNEGEKVYETPAPDFQLSLFELKAGEEFYLSPVTAEILLLTEGTAELTNSAGKIKLQPGSPSAIVFQGKQIRISSSEGGVVYRASVPVHKGE